MITPIAARVLAFLVAALSLSGCHGGDTGGQLDGGAVPDAALEPCVVGERELLLRDRDLDGFGDQQEARPLSCRERGWVAYPVDFRFDCDDRDSEANPDAPLRCDFDGDGVVGALDCDDRNGRRYPGAVERCNGFDDDCDELVDDADQVGLYLMRNNYALDEDGDGYPSLAVFACTPPGGAYQQWDETPPLDCAPLDPAVHPRQHDDCATQTDANCDGVFSPVYVAERWGEPRPDLAALFTQAGPMDPPVLVQLADPVSLVSSEDVDLCPGTYRVQIVIAGPGQSYSGNVRLRGHGTSADSVVLDAGGTGRNVLVYAQHNSGNRGSHLLAQDLTFTNGIASEAGGCLAHVENSGDPVGTLTLDRVVLRGCRAAEGGGIAVGANNTLTLTDVVFEDTSASIAGGAIHYDGRTAFTMLRGSFSDTRAPAGMGAAIFAVTGANGSLALQEVGLYAVSDDIAVSTLGGTVLRNLGAGASLTCAAAGCTP